MGEAAGRGGWAGVEPEGACPRRLQGRALPAVWEERFPPQAGPEGSVDLAAGGAKIANRDFPQPGLLALDEGGRCSFISTSKHSLMGPPPPPDPVDTPGWFSDGALNRAPFTVSVQQIFIRCLLEIGDCQGWQEPQTICDPFLPLKMRKQNPKWLREV